MRSNRHVHGCCHVIYSSTPMLREIIGMMQALMLVPSTADNPGVAQLAEQATVNR